MDDYYMPISALQHYAFCPRQFALIHIEQLWEENSFTAQGRLLHERVDSAESEQRGNVRYERGVLLVSKQYQIQGKMDLLEIKTGLDSKMHYIPVEYKRGKPKLEDWDRIQVCAQALCLEEMRQIDINEAAIWYWQVRRREQIMIDNHLRAITIDVIEQAHALFTSGKTPPVIADRSRCRSCSLINICEPQRFWRDHSVKYIEDLFSDQDE